MLSFEAMARGLGVTLGDAAPLRFSRSKFSVGGAAFSLSDSRGVDAGVPATEVEVRSAQLIKTVRSPRWMCLTLGLVMLPGAACGFAFEVEPARGRALYLPAYERYEPLVRHGKRLLDEM